MAQEKIKKEVISERQRKYRKTLSYNIRKKFTEYQKRDIEKGRCFDLSYDDFKIISESDCFYCGRYDNPNGVDRLYSSIGHIKENCVPCCKRCNQMKCDMPIDEFKEQIISIYFHLIEEEHM